ncbi:MAG: succinate dehydrogenase assembly factor 2 [Hyphomonadaceae bacterium]|jgi:antitoxin CptB|nr:succinate dehydrogenase assembly factor 2 [Hyphomonadaceae bacterium]
MDAREIRIKQLRFRAWRRGFREHDFLMGTFADQKLDGLDSKGLDAFEDLLEQADWDVYYWITSQRPVPPEFDSPVMEGLKALSFTVETIQRAV